MSEKSSTDESSSKKSGDSLKVEEDAISRIIGDTGRWQIQMMILLSLFNIPCTWHIYSMTFQSPVSDYWCAPPPNLDSLGVDIWRNISHTPAESHNSKDNPCLIWDLPYEDMTVENFTDIDCQTKPCPTRKCTHWRYQQSEPDESVTSQWNLVCEKVGLANAVEMSFLLGVAIGGLVSGMVSDRFGRKKTLMASLCLQITLGIAIAFCPYLELFLALRTLLGFISVGIVFSGFVLCLELVGGKWRTVAGVLYLMPVPISYIMIAGIAYYIRPWSELQLAITLPSILLLGLWWILPESPRWLLAVGKVEENIVILKEAARMNKRSLPPNINKILEQGTGQKTTEKATILDLFRYPRLRRISLVLCVIWFSVYFIYYGLVMNLSNIGGDIYVNTMLSGAVEVPSIAFSIIILLKLGRRWPLSVTIFCSGVACLITLPFGENMEWGTIAFAMTGKFCISCSNAIMTIYTAELYPTVVRNLGVGISNVAAGIALVLVPFIWDMAAIDQRLPMGLLGVTGIIGGLCVLLLEETANRPLKINLDD